MGKDGDDEGHPARDALQGIGLLFRAGRKTAKKLKKQLDASQVGKSIDDAGKEIARAIDNVVGRIAGEPKKPDGSEAPPKADDDKKDDANKQP
jgi:hypothetical protein